ncbi:MAG TPA: hypothetical protein EYP81_02110 [Thermodesulfobacteriaceae bacterium]|nr:hypothetical protein [Thermodesulfobacteriaceae bacterium]
MPELLELPLYPEPRGIFQVSASAGAGKTYRLALHYLRLLKSQGRPSEAGLSGIVALTFTNQAAAEMRERIVYFLKNIALFTDLGKKLSAETGLFPEEAAAWLETIFNHYHVFQVRTIDSLIFTLIRGLAIELGLRPELSAEIREDLFLNRAFDRLLLRLREDPKLEEVFARALFTFLEIEGRGGFNPEKHFRRRMRDIYGLLSQRTGGRLLEARDPGEALSALEEELRRLGRTLCERVLSERGEFAYPSWETYILDPPRYYWSKVFKKDSFRAVLKARCRKLAEALEGDYQRLKEKLSIYLTAKARAEVAPYERLFRELSGELLSLREEEGLLQVGSWTELLVRFLSENPPPLIYLKIGTRIRHFLIDEFQDTNRLQWQALYPLVEEVISSGGSLLYVGDVKQAIYMWRGGDPALFFEVPQGLPGEFFSESLPHNFRSAQRIVAFNNRFFSTLVERAHEVVRKLLHGRKPPKDCEVSEELASKLKTAFSDLEQEILPEAPEGEVEIVTVPSDEDRERFREGIFEKLAELIPGLYETYVRTGGTVAVLVRENREAEEIATFLFERGIPAVTDRALRLENSPLIKGILSLLQYLNYPEDETALAGFLKSPLPERGVGFLEAYLAEKRNGAPGLKAYLEARAEDLVDLLDGLFRDLERLSLYELVQAIVERFRLRERFPEEDLYLSRFLTAVLRYEEEALSLSDFLALWEEEGLEEKVGLPRELQAVRVFTIHAAKGLEFSAVVVPYLTWGPKGKDELVVTERGLIRARKESSEEVSRAKLREKGREVLESLNLLYVAFTRPRERLYIFLPEKTTNYTVGSVVREILGE